MRKIIPANDLRFGFAVAALLVMVSAGHGEFIENQPEDGGGASQAANLGRHHISFGPFGYFKSTANVFNSDFDHGTAQFLNYRYSFDEHTDLALDIHAWGQEKEYFGEKVTLTCGGLGLGFRYTMPPVSETFFFYLQGNFYDAVEGIEAGSESASWNGMGLGINGGFEMRLGRLISVPVEAFYLIAQPEDDISGYGFSAGVSFNWGKIESDYKQMTPIGRSMADRMPDSTAIEAQGSSNHVEYTVDDDQIKPADDSACTEAPELPVSGERPCPVSPRNNHLSAGVLGANKFLSRDFTSLSDAASTGYSYFLTYRQTVYKRLDIAMDLHAWTSDFDYSGSKVSVLVAGVGLGLRYNFIEPQKKIIPYIQLAALNVTEQVEHTEENYYTKAKARNLGLCINAGADIKVNDFLSIPIDAYLLSARPADNVTSLGATTGLSLHW